MLPPRPIERCRVVSEPRHWAHNCGWHPVPGVGAALPLTALERRHEARNEARTRPVDRRDCGTQRSVWISACVSTPRARKSLSARTLRHQSDCLTDARADTSRDRSDPSLRRNAARVACAAIGVAPVSRVTAWGARCSRADASAEEGQEFSRRSIRCCAVAMRRPVDRCVLSRSRRVHCVQPVQPAGAVERRDARERSVPPRLGRADARPQVAPASTPGATFRRSVGWSDP